MTQTWEEAIKMLTRLKDRINFEVTDAQKKMDALNMAINALKQTRWVPCTEKLPEDGTWNLFTDGKHISIERYKADALDHFYPDGRWFSFDDAIAWMSLPAPYKEEPRPEIIPCYQCKYAEVVDPEDDQDGYTCQFHRGSIWFSGSYCSWGEKMEEGDKNDCKRADY